MENRLPRPIFCWTFGTESASLDADLMKIKRYLLFFLLFCLSAGLFVLLSRSGAGTQAPKLPAMEDGALARAAGFVYTRTVDGRVNWKIEADEATYSEDRRDIRFGKVVGTFFGQENQTLRVNGAGGLFHVQRNELEVEGGVRIVSSLGYAMTTEKLRYSEDDKTVRAESSVFVHGNGISMTSGKMDFQVDQERLLLYDEVKGTLWNAKKIMEKGAEGN